MWACTYGIDHWMPAKLRLVDRFTAKLEDHFTNKLVNRLTAKLVDRLKLLSNFRTMKLQTKHPSKKTIAERRDERLAKIVGPNYEETTIAQKPSVAEDNEERNGLTEQQNSENQTVKEWSKG